MVDISFLLFQCWMLDCEIKPSWCHTSGHSRTHQSAPRIAPKSHEPEVSVNKATSMLETSATGMAIVPSRKVPPHSQVSLGLG